MRNVDWEVNVGERWVVLGPNGSGKTTLLALASGYLHPTRGQVAILGETLGRVDLRRLRRRIGLVSASIAKMLLPGVSALDVVVCGIDAALEPWWNNYAEHDRQRALHLLDLAGFSYVAERPWGVLSEGERQQVLLARSLMADPALVLLDEPAAGLDIAGRESLVSRLTALASEESPPTMVMVTHHVEEIPRGFTHAMLLRQGSVVSAGPITSALTSESLSATFGLGLVLGKDNGRFNCRTP